jgi:hypothetical protein
MNRTRYGLPQQNPDLLLVEVDGPQHGVPIVMAPRLRCTPPGRSDDASLAEAPVALGDGETYRAASAAARRGAAHMPVEEDGTER